jgi:hypothetical protein
MLESLRKYLESHNCYIKKANDFNFAFFTKRKKYVQFTTAIIYYFHGNKINNRGREFGHIFSQCCTLFPKCPVVSINCGVWEIVHWIRMFRLTDDTFLGWSHSYQLVEIRQVFAI